MAPAPTNWNTTWNASRTQNRSLEVTMRSCILFTERNIRGAWVVYGDLGVRQYYGYSKRESERRYREECRQTFVYNQK